MRLDTISKIHPAPRFKTPLVFVHGLWVNRWGWEEHFLDYFFAQGFDVYAPSLRGHEKSISEKSIRWIRLKEYVQDLDDVVSQLPRKPALIGHSNGGLIVQKYLEQHHDIPAGVLMASIPPEGIWRAAAVSAVKFPLSFLRANLTLSLLPLVDTPKKARFQFFSSTLPESEVERFQKKMNEESFLAFLDVLFLSLPKPKQVTTPLLVLGGEQDTAFTPRLVESTAKAYRTTAKIFPGMAHGMMLEKDWKLVADEIISWLPKYI